MYLVAVVAYETETCTTATHFQMHVVSFRIFLLLDTECALGLAASKTLGTIGDQRLEPGSKLHMR